MASNLTIDTGVIITFTDDTENSVADVNTTITEIVTKTNTFMEDHDHDGTNSSSISIGINGMTFEEYVLVQLMGMDF